MTRLKWSWHLFSARFKNGSGLFCFRTNASVKLFKQSHTILTSSDRVNSKAAFNPLINTLDMFYGRSKNPVLNEVLLSISTTMSMEFREAGQIWDT